MKVLLIDSYNMIHRARYGFGDGDHSTTFNFFRQLKSEIDRHTPDIVYMVDEGRPTQSLLVDSNYKGNRKTDPDESFHRQKKEIFNIAKTILGVKYAKHPECECDDVIAYLAEIHHSKDQIVIVSSDTDFIQVVNDRVQLWNPIKKEYIPQHHVDYVIWKSLKGDPTDNIPGIPGVGPKKADKLTMNPIAMQEFFAENPGSKEIFENAKTMIKFKSMNIEDIEFVNSAFDSEKLFEEFSTREFNSIIGKSWPKWVKSFGGLQNV